MFSQDFVVTLLVLLELLDLANFGLQILLDLVHALPLLFVLRLFAIGIPWFRLWGLEIELDVG